MITRIFRAPLRCALAATLLSVLTAGCLAEPLDDEAVAEEGGDESVDEAAMELGPNLVKNGGFESGWSPWFTFPNGGATVKRVEGKGTYLRMKDPSVAANATVIQNVDVTPGKKYHLLAKTVRRSGSGVPAFGVSFNGEEMAHEAKFVSAGTSKNWHWVSFDVTVPSWAHTANVLISSSTEDAASTYDWDGIGMHAL